MNAGYLKRVCSLREPRFLINASANNFVFSFEDSVYPVLRDKKAEKLVAKHTREKQVHCQICVVL